MGPRVLEHRELEKTPDCVTAVRRSVAIAGRHHGRLSVKFCEQAGEWEVSLIAFNASHSNSSQPD